jgi:hypothetical protein
LKHIDAEVLSKSIWLDVFERGYPAAWFAVGSIPQRSILGFALADVRGLMTCRLGSPPSCSTHQNARQNPFPGSLAAHATSMALLSPDRSGQSSRSGVQRQVKSTEEL